MIVLYDQSEVFKGLIIGTSNKTEILLGHTTMWGDMASALNPIGDLYKTQIRQLFAHFEIPAAIVDKAPSADLWVGQTDEGELGLSYKVDKLLYLLVDQRFSPQECVDEGFDEKFVTSVIARLEGARNRHGSCISGSPRNESSKCDASNESARRPIFARPSGLLPFL